MFLIVACSAFNSVMDHRLQDEHTKRFYFYSL